MEGILDLLTTGGPMGIFAAFLLHERAKAQAQMDEWVKGWKFEIREIHERAEAAEESLRDRYDSVLLSKDLELAASREQVVSLLSDIKRDSAECLRKLSGVQAK